MNHPFIIEAARSFLNRPDVMELGDRKNKIARLFSLAYGRPPTSEEFTTIHQYFGDRVADSRRWQSFAQAILMANEFVFVD